MVNVPKCPIGVRSKPSTEYVIDGKAYIYCMGWVDISTDEPLKACKACSDHVGKAQEQYERRLEERRNDERR